MMSATSQVQLRIQQIDLDVLNPRIPGARDPADALNRIVSGQRGKLLRLAKDISDRGLSPGELPYVIAGDAGSALFVALDGNRRFAALKLLDNPALDGEVPFFATSEGKSLLRRLQALRPSFDRNSIEPITCVLFASRDDAEPWLQRRHAGEMDGLGLTVWNAEERLRSRDPNSPMVVLSDFLRNEGLSAEEEQVVDGQWTTVGRLIEGPTLRSLLGLDLSGKILQSRVAPDVLMRVMRVVILGMGAMQRRPAS